MFRLSALSRWRSPASFSFPASSRVTARVTSNVRPCKTKFWDIDAEGSGVSKEGNLNGFFLGYACG